VSNMHDPWTEDLYEKIARLEAECGDADRLVERVRPQSKRDTAMPNHNTQAWADWVRTEICETIYSNNDIIGEEFRLLRGRISELETEVGQLKAAAHVTERAATLDLPNFLTRTH
jgi:hypothetical protein